MDTAALTSLFKKNGHLGDGQVTSAELTPIKTIGIASEFFLLDLSYSSDDHTLPKRMAVKCPAVNALGQGEAAVYDNILGYHSDLPIMKCYGILGEDSAEPIHFLFKDLSETHHQTPWPIVPKLPEFEQAISTIAKVHANWWGKLDSLPDMTPPIAAHQNTSHLMKFFPKFVDLVGAYLSPARLAIYENTFKDLDALLAKRLTADNTTLLHTDTHLWNFLYPNNPEQDECIIFDWPMWNTGLAGSDLAYMIALHLYPEHRRRFEPILLDRYAQVLNEQGVAYDRDDVQLDYRIGIIIGLLEPIMEFSWQNPHYIWTAKLEKVLSAFEDHHCGELLDSV